MTACAPAAVAQSPIIDLASFGAVHVAPTRTSANAGSVSLLAAFYGHRVKHSDTTGRTAPCPLGTAANASAVGSDIRPRNAYVAKGRPPLPIGTWGAVSVANIGPSKYKARARFRDATGTRAVARFGQTKAEARRRLAEALAKERERVGSTTVDRTTTVADVADRWLATRGGRSPWSIRTVQTYELTVAKHVKPLLGNLRIGELRPSLVDGTLERVMRESGPGAAAHVKRCLSGISKLAVRYDAIPYNPTRDSVSTTSRPEPARSLTAAEIETLIDGLRSDTLACELDLPDLVEWMLGTGCRIGEALAARYAMLTRTDVGTLWEINGTVVRVKGQGMVLQPRPKTESSWRVILLPTYLDAMLERRKVEVRFDAPEHVVFPSPFGNALRDSSNTAKQLREVFARLGFDGLHSHVFRKTAATMLDMAKMSPREIADQLGHANPSMTMSRYMGRRLSTTEAAKVLDR